jgi:hypothetical protein
MINITALGGLGYMHEGACMVMQMYGVEKQRS